MTGENASRTETDWLTLRRLVEEMDQPLARVKHLIDERHLLATRRTGQLTVPSVFLVEGEPLASLRGTVIVLQDAGFTDDEAIDWLLDREDSIGLPPIEALRAGRKSEVRRVAQSVG